MRPVADCVALEGVSRPLRAAANPLLRREGGVKVGERETERARARESKSEKRERARARARKRENALRPRGEHKSHVWHAVTCLVAQKKEDARQGATCHDSPGW